MTCGGRGGSFAEHQRAGNCDPGAARPDGVTVRFRAGTVAQLSAALLSVSVSEHDLEGGNAAELEVGVETASGLGAAMPEPAFLCHLGLVSGKGVGIISTLSPVWSPGSLRPPTGGCLVAPTTRGAWWTSPSRPRGCAQKYASGWGLGESLQIRVSCLQRKVALTLRAVTSSPGLCIRHPPGFHVAISGDPSPLLSHPRCRPPGPVDLCRDGSPRERASATLVLQLCAGGGEASSLQRG